MRILYTLLRVKNLENYARKIVYVGFGGGAIFH